MTVLITGSQGRIGTALAERVPTQGWALCTFDLCAAAPPDAQGSATWLSFDDCARLVDRCLRAPDLSYAEVWGVSANRDRWWSLTDPIGFVPVTDAADQADPGGSPAPTDDVVGGAFTGTSFGIDEIEAQR